MSMNILFVSALEGHKWQGPTHSVPKQVASQAVIDNVLWLNLCMSDNKDWGKLPYYREMPTGLKTELNIIEPPFNKPDVVVFEGVYEYPFAQIVLDIWKQCIPYIIVPRSALTSDAQNKRKFKKIVGNLLFFNAFIRNAAAIQYLTPAEKIESSKWKTKGYVIPNGIDFTSDRKKSFFENNKIILTYIGRLEKYQKGLDMLVEACRIVQKELREASVEIHIYGPDREGSYADLADAVDKNELNDCVFLHGAVFDDEKTEVLLTSDAFIMTSRFEGLPMGLIEAISLGIPCLVTRGTNMSDEVAGSNAGWISENNTDSIAQMLLMMIREKDQFSEKSEGAYELANKYNWRTIAKTSHKLYSELMDEMGRNGNINLQG